MKKRSGYFIAFLTMCHLFMSPLALASNETTFDSSFFDDASCKISEFGNFCLMRIPNSNEITADVVIVVPLDMLISQFVNLGSPLAKSVIRDSTKVLSVIYKIYTGTSVGSTNFKFDMSNLYSQLTKSGIKVVGIAVGVKMGYRPEEAASAVNFPGDIFSRALVKAGMSKQKSPEAASQSFEEYFVHNIDIQWLIQATTEVFPKLGAMTLLDALFFKKLGITRLIGNAVFSLPNYILGSSLLAANTIGANAALLNGRNPFLAYSVAGLVGLSSTFLQQLASTYILATFSRITMDSVAAISETFSSELGKENSNPFFISPFYSTSSPFFIWPF